MNASHNSIPNALFFSLMEIEFTIKVTLFLTHKNDMIIFFCTLVTQHMGAVLNTVANNCNKFGLNANLFLFSRSK